MYIIIDSFRFRCVSEPNNLMSDWKQAVPIFFCSLPYTLNFPLLSLSLSHFATRIHLGWTSALHQRMRKANPFFNGISANGFIVLQLNDWHRHKHSMQGIVLIWSTFFIRTILELIYSNIEFLSIHHFFREENHFFVQIQLRIMILILV